MWISQVDAQTNIRWVFSQLPTLRKMHRNGSQASALWSPMRVASQINYTGYMRNIRSTWLWSRPIHFVNLWCRLQTNTVVTFTSKYVKISYPGFFCLNEAWNPATQCIYDSANMIDIQSQDHRRKTHEAVQIRMHQISQAHQWRGLDIIHVNYSLHIAAPQSGLMKSTNQSVRKPNIVVNRVCVQINWAY